MHRTQIMLEPEQHAALRELARRSGKSMGQLIREFVEFGLEQRLPKRRDGQNPLKRLQGFIAKADTTGRDHDAALYGDE